MFTKIDIKKFGLYKDFVWPKDLQPFGRVNIIYGRNYSGKTTLSRIFDGVSQGVLHKDYTDGEFTIETDDDSTKVITQSNMNDCPYAVRVYNSDYVKRNLGWLNNEENGEIVPFTLLGSDNVEAQKAIEEIDEKLGSVEEKMGLLYADEVATQEYKARKQKHEEDVAWLEGQLKGKANGDIKKKPYYVRQDTYYNVNNLKGDIATILKSEEYVQEGASISEPPMTLHRYRLDDSVALTDEDKARLKSTVAENEKKAITTLPELEPHLNVFEARTVELVTKRITLTKTLQELVTNDLLQAWVDEGRELNKDRDRCAFCGNPITKERREELNAHFSKESEELKRELTSLRGKLENANMALDEYLEGKGLTKENVYTSFCDEYEQVIGEWNAYVAKYKKAIGRLIGLIDERLANIFKPIDSIPESQDYDSTEGFSLMPILKRMNELIGKNNEYGLKLEKEQQDARDRLRLNAVYHFCTDIKYTEALERQEKEEEVLNRMWGGVMYLASEIGLLRKKRKQKELDRKDEGKAAKQVTDLLYNHFGNGSLSLEPETVIGPIVVGDADASERPRTKFVVKRGGEYAKNLSEGEKSLISFCYFIAQMADELKGPEASKLVVYIDDPISSLDSSHIFFMYSLIESVIAKPMKFGQLFISTHNLEFLKFMKRIKVKGNMSHYVVVKLGKGNTENYRCEIREMPLYLRKYMTEYNFLFEQIYDIAKLNSEEDQTLYAEQYTLYYNIGNNMRKFLECYLFNRYPDTDDPLRKHLTDMFEDYVPSEVNRVVNEYSHLAWAERGMRVMEVPEVVTAAKEILKALQKKDRAHYETLCQSVGKDSSVRFE